jgi:hypothetical protein
MPTNLSSDDINVEAAAAFRQASQSNATQDLAAVLRSAANETESMVADKNEPFSPRRGFTYKRAEEPPKNGNDKYICKFQNTCAGLTFDRKCEWSKHMDKHERPYKCEAPGCEKLQGFTYSGGLLRHQREVHKMHGGTKEALYCPFPNCKRSSGSGFTRKENRDEHIRRVHRRATDGSDMSNQSNKRDHEMMEQDDSLLGGEVLAPPEESTPENIDPNISGPKRRRVTQGMAALAANGVSGTPGMANGDHETNGTGAGAIESNLELKSMMAIVKRLEGQNRALAQQVQTLTDRVHRLEDNATRTIALNSDEMLG